MTANCSKTQTGNTPLFPGIMAPMPEKHAALGIEVASQIKKVNGKLVVDFDGMSNWNQEMKAFTRLAKEEGIRGVTWNNAGRGGWDLSRMVTAADEYWAWVQNGLTKRNISSEQVQVMFIKNSVRHGTTIDGFKNLLDRHISRAATEFKGLQQVFVSSALYSGYAGSGAPRTEPHAFYEGVAVQQYIEERYGTTGPWIGWGPYLWADGLRPRGDGLVWKCTDFESKDGVHPGPLAEAKVAEMMLRFMRNSPVTGWFTGG